MSERAFFLTGLAQGKDMSASDFRPPSLQLTEDEIVRKGVDYWSAKVRRHIDEMQKAVRLYGPTSTSALFSQALAVDAAISAGTNYKLMPLRSVCAWCQTEMRPGRQPETHGMCPACITREESSTVNQGEPS